MQEERSKADKWAKYPRNACVPTTIESYNILFVGWLGG